MPNRMMTHENFPENVVRLRRKICIIWQHFCETCAPVHEPFISCPAISSWSDGARPIKKCVIITIIINRTISDVYKSISNNRKRTSHILFISLWPCSNEKKLVYLSSISHDSKLLVTAALLLTALVKSLLFFLFSSFSLALFFTFKFNFITNSHSVIASGTECTEFFFHFYQFFGVLNASK